MRNLLNILIFKSVCIRLQPDGSSLRAASLTSLVAGREPVTEGLIAVAFRFRMLAVLPDCDLITSNASAGGGTPHRERHDCVYVNACLDTGDGLLVYCLKCYGSYSSSSVTTTPLHIGPVS